MADTGLGLAFLSSQRSVPAAFTGTSTNLVQVTTVATGHQVGHSRACRQADAGLDLVLPLASCVMLLK